jgi:hypothetical protein
MANVSVKSSGGDSHEIHLSGVKLDGKTVEGCIKAVTECGCLNNGVHLTAKCLETVRRHEEVSHCISKCFGCQ